MTAAVSRPEAPALPRKLARIGYFFVGLTMLLYGTKLGFSPVYPLLFVPLALLPLVAGSRASPALLCALIGLLGYALANSLILAGKWSESGNLVQALLIAILMIGLRDLLSRHDIVRGAILSIRVNAWILAADSAWRITHPALPTGALQSGEEADTFYLFKFSSLMFADSNTTALAVLSLFFLGLYLRNRHGARIGGTLLLLTLVLVSCLSRAAYGAFAVGLFLFWIGRAAVPRLVAGLLLPPALAYLIAIINDGSLLTKFGIVSIVLTHLARAPAWELAFGMGLGNSEAVFGIYTHLWPATYVVGLGFLGLALLLLVLALVSWQSRGAALYIIIPTFLAGLSYYFYAGSVFMWHPFIVIWMLETHRHRVGFTPASPAVPG